MAEYTEMMGQEETSDCSPQDFRKQKERGSSSANIGNQPIGWTRVILMLS
jgi:hypothetical protein